MLAESGGIAGKAPIRLRDIAKKAGVSAATVSLVLNDKGAISEATRARIKKLIFDSGYIYNKRAASMRTRRTYDVGVLLQDITNPYFAEMLSGLSGFLSNSRYLYFLAIAEEDAGRQERFLKAFMETGMDGAILYLNRDTPPGLLDELKRWGRPVVLAYRRFGRDDFDYLGTDHYFGGKMAAEALIRAGHRRIVFAGGSKKTENRRMRHQGYVDALREAGLDADPGDDYSLDSNTQKDGVDLSERILSGSRGATAAMFYTDALALGALGAFRRRGLTPGRDMGIIGFDDIREAEMSIPGLCTVSADPFGMGQRLAETLLVRIADPDRSFTQVFEKPRLMIRETSGCPRDVSCAIPEAAVPEGNRWRQ